MKILRLILCLLLLMNFGAQARDVIFQDGLTKVSDTKVEGDYSLVAMFVSASETNSHGTFPGLGSIKTITSSTKCTATLPACDSIAEFRFWLKAADDNPPQVQIKRQINGGAWETIHALTELSTSYVEKVVQVNTAAKNTRLQLYIEKTATQAGYYFDDFSMTRCTGCVFKEASFASVFTPNMVLQRDKEVAVFGTASENLPLTLEIQGQTLTTTSSNGKFEFTTQALTVGGPYTMRMSWDGGFKQIDNIYVGDVFIAGGQSNMDFAMRKVESYEAIEKPAANYPQIKYYSVPKDYYEGHNKPSGNWVSCTPEQISEAFAVAYYAARDIYIDQQIPIGIIQCGLGGTSAESWMSREILLSDPRFSKELTDYDNIVASYAPGQYEDLLAQYNAGKLTTEPTGPKNFRRPAGMYYTMFQKIIPFTCKGIFFYQGETNAKRGFDYRYLFPALINLWRTDLKQPDLPFLFVQLPKFTSSTNWAEIRESQYLTSRTVLNTGMCVAFDQGNPSDIHPTRKDTVGIRLAKVTLAKVYGKNIPYSGPEYKNMNVRDGKIILYFDHINGGLTVRGTTLNGFTICGSNEQFYSATAVIQGDSIVVSSASVPSPQHVRYGWFSSGDMNLYNEANLPASSFRTDKFTLTTENSQSGGNSEETRLSNISINGVALSNFHAETLRYGVSLASSTTVIPVVSGTPLDASATVGVVQATSLSGSESERTATIIVTAEDLWTVREYKVVFDLNGTQASTAQLQRILLDGVSMSNFHPDTIYYVCPVHRLPIVSAEALDATDSVHIMQALSLKGSLWERTAVVTVTSRDLSVDKQYTITFEQDAAQQINTLDAKQLELLIQGRTLSINAHGLLNIYTTTGLLVVSQLAVGNTQVQLPMPGIYIVAVKEKNAYYSGKILIGN